MSQEPMQTTYPALPACLIRWAVDLFMPWHVLKTLATPIWHVFGLLDTGYIFGNCSFAKHVEVVEDAFVGEVEPAVAMVAVLLNDLVLGTSLGDVSLFMAVVAEAVAASAL